MSSSKLSNHCCVPHCRSWAKRNPEKELSFHLFPKKNSGKVYFESRMGKELVDRRRAWILGLGIGKPVTKFMKVCSLHFIAEDYFNKGQRSGSRGRELKETAVPFHNLPTPKTVSSTLEAHSSQSYKLEALQGGSGVISKYLEVEERRSKYDKLEGTDDKSQVEVKDVQEFMFGPIIKSETEWFGVDKLEVQEEYIGMAEAEIKYETEISDTELIIKTEDVDIKLERVDCDVTDMKSEESDCDGFQEPFSENNSPSEIKMFKCEFCSYQTKRKSHLTRHLLIHKNPLDIKMFKCEDCSYETKHRYALKTHFLLAHKSPSEIKMFKCEMCSYEAKVKSNLKKHLLAHKNASEINMFKCELCSYETKQKCHLKIHLLTHKSSSELKMFKCEMCQYEAKRKSNLRQHLFTHKIKMFKCGLCSYEANRKSSLQTHLLTHTSPPEGKVFKCELCPYDAKRKFDLKRHLLNHKIILK